MNCAALIHRHLRDKAHDGTVRASVGAFTAREDLDALLEALRGLDRASALRFSFLLSVPAILGAGALQLVQALRAPFDPALLPPCLAGAAAAALSGAGFLRLTRRLVLRGRFGPFGWYCLALGLGVLLLAPAAG